MLSLDMMGHQRSGPGHVLFFASSAESVGDFRLGQFAKPMVEGNLAFLSLGPGSGDEGRRNGPIQGPMPFRAHEVDNPCVVNANHLRVGVTGQKKSGAAAQEGRLDPNPDPRGG